MENPDYWINRLELSPHPEGGYYRQTYSSVKEIKIDQISGRTRGSRTLATSIYYLLKSNVVSRFHRLKSDEIWYYHLGSSLTIHTISIEGLWNEIRLGSDPEKGEVLQAVLPAGSTFGACVNKPGSFAIIGCMVSPGFDFRDFELVKRSLLLRKYPGYEDVILKLTAEK